MSRPFSDSDLLQFLENGHTYDEAMKKFGVSRMTIARMKQRTSDVPLAARSSEKIHIAIVGVGNAASALIQGIEFYKYRQTNMGLLRPTLAGYHISDIEVVAAFDVSRKKVGKSFTDALKENDYPMVIELENHANVQVMMGSLQDGVINETREIIDPADQSPVDVAKVLKDSKTEIVLCLLPSGANEAVTFYAEQALQAGCGFINATPTPIANNKPLAKKFQQAGLPLIGDDLQDQFGATILHKLILQQMIDRGVDIKESYALDVGGGTESLNTLFRSRDVKRTIKSMSVSSALNVNAPIVAGTSDYVPHMGNNRNSMLWIVGRGFLGSEIIIDIKIQTEDGPNGGSVLADVIRATKVALNQGATGPIDAISAYGFKNPPSGPKNPSEASTALANFILGIK